MKSHHEGCTTRTEKNLDETEWATVGANLRNIADDFQASKTKVKIDLFFPTTCVTLLNVFFIYKIVVN